VDRRLIRTCQPSVKRFGSLGFEDPTIHLPGPIDTQILDVRLRNAALAQQHSRFGWIEIVTHLRRALALSSTAILTGRLASDDMLSGGWTEIFSDHYWQAVAASVARRFAHPRDPPDRGFQHTTAARADLWTTSHSLRTVTAARFIKDLRYLEVKQYR
jgi:hypothetical protein